MQSRTLFALAALPAMATAFVCPSFMPATAGRVALRSTAASAMNQARVSEIPQNIPRPLCPPASTRIFTISLLRRHSLGLDSGSRSETWMIITFADRAVLLLLLDSSSEPVFRACVASFPCRLPRRPSLSPCRPPTTTSFSLEAFPGLLTPRTSAR